MKNILLLILLCACISAGCAQKNDYYLITLHTEFGEIKMVLYDQTPRHKENFLKLARSGAYDSTTFHRIIKDFMIQGGDVMAKPGYEGSEYTIPAEFVDTLIHYRGAVAAARQSDQMNPKRASSGSQFYIVQGRVWSARELTTDMKKVNQYIPKLAEVPGYQGVIDTLNALYYGAGMEAFNDKMFELVPVMEERFGISFSVPYSKERLQLYTTLGGQPHLDDTYTVFGRVVEGMDVVDKIAAVITGPGDKPREDVPMTVEVEAMPKKKLQKKYPWPY